MKQDSTGGYCPRCDTVWASPEVCRCDPLLAKHETAVSVFETEIWNKAIEAAIDKINDRGSYGDDALADSMRELMK